MTATVAPPTGPAAERPGARVGRLLRAVPPIWLVLAVVIVLIAWRNPTFVEPGPFLAFLRRCAPLAVLAAGQVFVIIAGEFDLSVGALVTAVVVVAARLSDGDPAATWWLIPLLLAAGAGVGLVNGLVTTRLRVPSFIATLGMLLVLNGAVFLWSGGAPRGSLADNFRQFGRFGIDLPGLGQLPYAVLILVAVGVGSWLLLSHSRFGHQVYAAGGNPRAAALSGVDVRRVRTVAFVISGLAAVVAGILLGGFPGSPPRPAWVTSSRRSPPSCSAARCRAGVAAASAPPSPARSPCNRCSPCSTSWAWPSRCATRCRA
ncbi:ABC transporter permease [Micromonospora sp. URMC 105]|uniref:ABC transporter permease n=1 Tax=Micromonospora sp. URMC 105 TaxID=3423413 RepID=UPI003F1CEBFE